MGALTPNIPIVEHAHDHGEHGRRAQGALLGVLQCVGLWQDFGEDDEKHRHRERGVDDAALAEQGDEQGGRKRRRRGVDEIVADENGRDDLVLVLAETRQLSRASVAVLRLSVDIGAACRSEGRFSSGKNGRKNKKNQYNAEYKPTLGVHGAESSCRTFAESVYQSARQV